MNILLYTYIHMYYNIFCTGRRRQRDDWLYDEDQIKDCSCFPNITMIFASARTPRKTHLRTNTTTQTHEWWQCLAVFGRSEGVCGWGCNDDGGGSEGKMGRLWLAGWFVRTTAFGRMAKKVTRLHKSKPGFIRKLAAWCCAATTIHMYAMLYTFDDMLLLAS